MSRVFLWSYFVNTIYPKLLINDLNHVRTVVVPEEHLVGRAIA